MILTCEDMQALTDSGRLVLVAPTARGTVWIAIPSSWCSPASRSAENRVRAAFTCGALMQLHELISAA